jgi:putative flippase GtrA
MIISKKILMINKLQNSSFFSYLFVGGISFIIDFAIFFVFLNYFKLSALFSSGVSFTIAVLCNYFLCYCFVFKKGSLSIIYQILNIFIISIISLIVHLMLLKWMIFLFVPSIIAKLIITPFLTYWNYFAKKKLVFYNKK